MRKIRIPRERLCKIPKIQNIFARIVFSFFNHKPAVKKGPGFAISQSGDFLLIHQQENS